MQRDPEYLREILFEMEESADDFLILTQAFGMGPDERKRWYHVQLLCDTGLVTQISDSGFRLTSQGYDFVDAVRDEGRWRKVMGWISDKGGGLTIDIIKALAVGLLKEELSEHSGIPL